MNPIELIQKYYPIESRRYCILISHSQDVASLAIRIAEANEHLTIDKEFVYEAAMLHDIGIYLTSAPTIDCYGVQPYIRHGYLGAELLRAEGLSKHALVAERHTGTGITVDMIREQGIDLPKGHYTPETLEEKLICYADKFFSKTKLGKQKERDRVRTSLAKYGEEAVVRFDQLEQLFGVVTPHTSSID